MLIAVTGATGFLGRYLVRQLIEARHRLRCWHRPSSDLSGFGEANATIEWLPGQLGEVGATRDLVRGADAVVHAAVEWEGPRNRRTGSHGVPDVFLGINLTGSLQLFQSAFAADVPRCVFISTCDVHEVKRNQLGGRRCFMFDRRMIGIPNRTEKGMVEIELPPGWLAHDHPAVRVANVGEPVLTYVAVLSAAEAAAINSEYKQRAEDEVRKNLEVKGPGYLCQHLEIAIESAKKVERLLATIKQEGYFSSWMLIEACSID